MENGGRIFLPSHPSNTAAPIVEDLVWRQHHVAAPMVLESVAPEERPGALWELYKKLQQEGWACDANKYSTDFRVSLKKSHGKTAADLERVILNLPSQLTSSFNLGSADFYPSTSGKDKAAQYLMSKFGFSKEESISMGDDDNDLALASVVGHTYIPGFTAASVRKAVEGNPLAFTVASHGAFLGTHEVLEMIQELPVGSRRPWIVGSIFVLSLLLLARSRRRAASTWDGSRFWHDFPKRRWFQSDAPWRNKRWEACHGLFLKQKEKIHKYYKDEITEFWTKNTQRNKTTTPTFFCWNLNTQTFSNSWHLFCTLFFKVGTIKKKIGKQVQENPFCFERTKNPDKDRGLAQHDHPRPKPQLPRFGPRANAWMERLSWLGGFKNQRLNWRGLAASSGHTWWHLRKNGWFTWNA